MQLTIKTKLLTDDDTLQALKATQTAFTGSFNRIAKHGWDMERPNKIEIHHQTYYQEKNLSKLPSALLITARDKAVEAIKSARARIRKGKKASCPQSKQTAVRYTTRGVTIKLAEAKATIVTMNGRKKVDLQLSDYHRQFDRCKVCMADLVFYGSTPYLNVVIEVEEPKFASNDKTVGIDLGVNRPAVTSENKFLGERRWKGIEHRISYLRSKLQSKGTKSAKRHLKKLGRKVNRFRKDCDHVLSKQIVDSVESGSTIVLEDLTDIRARVKARRKQRKRIHSWSFHRLKEFLTYKASLKGVGVEFVDPRYTSQKCSRCGYIDKRNRKTQSDFRCRECGFKHNADLNAAKNIRNNHLDSIGKLQSNQAVVNQPIAATSG